MRPRLLPILAVASLVCCVLLCGLWVRSYRVSDNVQYRGAGGVSWIAGANGGQVKAGRLTGMRATKPGLQFATVPAVPGSDIAATARAMGGWGWSAIGLGMGGWSGGGQEGRCVQLPLWFPTLLTAIPPALWWRRGRAARVRGFEVGAVPASDP